MINRFAVGMGGNGDVVIRQLPRHSLRREDAMNLAAWLAVLADPAGEGFDVVLERARQHSRDLDLKARAT